jgi:hypothetical protein
LSETSATNLCLQSQTVNTWALVGVTAPTTNVVCPDGITRTTCTLHEDGTTGLHYGNSSAGVSDATGYVFSVWLKAGTRNWAAVEFNAKYCYFDLANGVVGTALNAVGTIQDWGNGWYRCFITITTTSTSGVPRVYVASANGSVNFAGTNSDSLYIFGGQAELGNYPSSYIPTVSAVTRTVDNLTYVGTGNINMARGSIAFDVLASNATYTNRETYIAVPGTSGGLINIETTNSGLANESSFIFGAAQVLSGAVTVKDGLVHSLRGTWQTNSTILYRDNVSVGTPSTSVTPPTDPPTSIYIGQNNANLLQAKALITNLRIFGIPTLKR